jgi:hypothetical protein
MYLAWFAAARLVCGKTPGHSLRGLSLLFQAAIY